MIERNYGILERTHGEKLWREIIVRNTPVVLYPPPTPNFWSPVANSRIFCHYWIYYQSHHHHHHLIIINPITIIIVATIINMTIIICVLCCKKCWLSICIVVYCITGQWCICICVVKYMIYMILGNVGSARWPILPTTAVIMLSSTSSSILGVTVQKFHKWWINTFASWALASGFFSILFYC